MVQSFFFHENQLISKAEVIKKEIKVEENKENGKNKTKKKKRKKGEEREEGRKKRKRKKDINTESNKILNI